MEVLTRSRARIQPLTVEVGAEVRDVDLEHLDDETFERMQKAFFFKGAVRMARFTRRPLAPSEFIKIKR